MPDFSLRRITTQIEEIPHEGGPVPTSHCPRGAIMAVCRNPFAGAFAPDLQPAMEDLKPFGLVPTDRLIAALGGLGEIDGYGKGALGALWYVPGGYAMRERLGESRAVPSAMKVAPDVPLGHINAAYVRSHSDAITVCVPDGPRADEIVFVLAMKGGCIHSRMRGCQVRGEDGLR